MLHKVTSVLYKFKLYTVVVGSVITAELETKTYPDTHSSVVG